MTTRKLERAEWRTFCDRVSKSLGGKQVEIRIASPALGSQIEAKWLPLMGIVYDQKSEMIEIVLEGLDHMINRPQELHVEDGPAGLASLQVVDADGIRQIITLRDPLMLPPPGAAH
jgi:hypothetical protein